MGGKESSNFELNKLCLSGAGADRGTAYTSVLCRSVPASVCEAGENIHAAGQQGSSWGGEGAGTERFRG